MCKQQFLTCSGCLKNTNDTGLLADSCYWPHLHINIWFVWENIVWILISDISSISFFNFQHLVLKSVLIILIVLASNPVSICKSIKCGWLTCQQTWCILAFFLPLQMRCWDLMFFRSHYDLLLSCITVCFSCRWTVCIQFIFNNHS